MNKQTAIEANTLNIAQRIAAVMGEVDYVQKEKKQGMNYSIVSHDRVTALVRPLLHKYGVICYPVNMTVQQVGNRTEAQFDVRFVNVDNRDDFIDVATLGYGVDGQDKGPGKAISYGVKYAYLKCLGLETGDDPDTVQDASADYRPSTGETEHRDPTIPGITKIRNNLNKLRRDGAAATDLDAFNTLVSAHKDDLQKIKDAEHSLWTGMGEDFDGFKAWIVRRRNEFAGSATYQLLLSTLYDCETPAQLQNWLGRNGNIVETLDGEESRKFETLFDEYEAGLKAVETINA